MTRFDARRRRGATRAAAVSALLLLLFGSLSAGVSAATSTTAITYLGPPANIVSTNQYFPLDGFRRATTALRTSGKPEVLFLGGLGGTPSFDQINAERWPLVKALDQFGTWTGVRSTERSCVTLQGGLINGQTACGVPSFDLSRARYTSRYLSFVSKDLVRLDKQGHVRAFQRPSSAEWALFLRYVEGKGECYVAGKRGRAPSAVPCKGYAQYVQVSLSRRPSERTLPLLAVGGYLQTLSQIVVSADFKQSTPVAVPGVSPTPGASTTGVAVDRGLPFATIRGALVNGHNPVPGSNLITDVNAEANIITALICRADGLRPKSVCGRSAIKSILKHAR